MSDSAIATSSTTPAKAKTKKNRLSGSFFRFVLTRFLLIIPTVFILVTIVFFVMRATGDPISAALGGRLTPAELQQRIHAAGYDRPLIVQYVDYLGGLLHGDLGTTLTDNQPVISILTHYGAATFELAFLALIVALIVGIGLGRLAARKRDRAADAGIRTFAILCYATPVFFLGLVLKLIFAVWLNILPASGRSDLNSEMQFTRLVSPTGFYIIDAIQKGWAKKWRANGWMRNAKDPALNPDLWEKLLDLLEKHEVSFVWVKGHAGHPENERCDQLAVQESLKFKA